MTPIPNTYNESEDSDEMPALDPALDSALESDSMSSDSHSSSRRLTKTLENPPSDFVVDKALSTELMGLSLESRLAIEEEIHGVVSEKEESPAFLDKKLEEFDRLLNANKTMVKENDPQNAHRRFLLRNVIRTYGNSNNSNNSTYGNNSNNNNCYLNDNHVRLRFLRSDLFDVHKAVDRLICFLEFTSELFGDFVADRPIAISDFSRQEEYFLRHSRSQYLPFRDRSGRRVQVGVGSINFHIPIQLRFKIIMFLQWIVSEDVETQRKGIVTIIWPFNEHTDSATDADADANMEAWQESDSSGSETSDAATERNWKNMRGRMTKEIVIYFQKYNNSSPLRLAGIHHYLQDTPVFRAASALFVFYGIKREYWSIYRSHFGQEIELRYKLSNYGIPEALMPMTTTGKVKTDYQSSWVSMLKFKEEQKKKMEQQRKLSFKKNIPCNISCESPSEQLEIVECPSSNDVVFRKGRPLYKRNPGNMQYRELIAAASDQHSEAGRSGKYAITWKIVQQIEAKGGRFLEWTPLGHGSGGMWIVMTDRKAIREKIASALKQYNRDHFKSNSINNIHNNTKTSQENKTTSQRASQRQKTATTITTKSSQHDQDGEKASKVISDDGTSPVFAPAITSEFKPFGFEGTDHQSYFFLQSGHRAHDGSTKRRKITLMCGDIASNCRPGSNANIANNRMVSGHHLQPSDTMYNHMLQNQMLDFNMSDDSSCFGKYFFPTG